MYKVAALLCYFVCALSAKAQSKFDYSTDFARIASQTADAKSKLYYPALRNRFVAHDPSLTNDELLALQIGHTRQANYRPYRDIDVERGIFALNAKGHFTAALELATSYQKRNPFSLMLNLEKSYSLQKTGQTDSATIYLAKYERLIETLLATGDGDKSPYFVLGPIDGQILISRYLQGELGTMGSGFDKKGNMLDMLEMKDKATGKTRTYSFHIKHASATILK